MRRVQPPRACKRARGLDVPAESGKRVCVEHAHVGVEHPTLSDALVHVLRCSGCSFYGCRPLNCLREHAETCRSEPRVCKMCNVYWCVLHKHAKKCTDMDCRIWSCDDLKELRVLAQPTPDQFAVLIGNMTPDAGADAGTDAMVPLRGMECCICMERPRQVVMYPCSHLSVCTVCIPEIQRRGSCPLCRAPVSALQHGRWTYRLERERVRFATMMCDHCGEHQKEVMLLPCGHIPFCRECAPTAMHTATCPVCSATPHMVRRVFIP